MRIWAQKSASMQKRTSLLKFGDLAAKSLLNSVSDLSTKVPGPAGEDVKFLCEVQLTLSPIAILKKSEQKIYSLMRMESPQELRDQYVFSRKSEEDESTVLTSNSYTGSDGASPLDKKTIPNDPLGSLTFPNCSYLFLTFLCF